MRFRLATNGAGGEQLAGGIGNAFRNMAMLPMYQAQAAQEGQEAQARLGLISAQQRQAESAAAAAQYKLQQDQQEAQSHRERTGVGALLQNAAMMHGVSPSQAPDFAQFAQTGRLPGRYEAPVDGVGPVQPTPGFYTDDTAKRIYQTLGLSQHALAAGDKSVENLAKAQQAYRAMGLGDDVLEGRRTAGAVGQAQAAMDGKKLFDALGNTGVGYNQFTGEAQVMDRGLRAIWGDQSAAGIEAARARAGASRASAASSYASAAKTRDEMARGARAGDITVVTGPDGTVNLVNKLTREAHQVTGANGAPLVKGSAGGAGKTMTEGQAKANLFGTRMTEANKIFDELAGQGVRVASQVKRGADAVPVIGPALGMLANSTVVSPAQQRLEQGQRDFINAVLRRESGAVIADSEFASAAQQYFPQPGDSPAVIQQKRTNRERAAQLLLMEVPASVREQSQALGSGGATGSWGPAAGGGRNVTVDY